MYPKTYYEVLMPSYRETGQVETRCDDLSGRCYELRWQAVSFVTIGIAEDMEDAKARYPWIKNPILKPVGFKPRDLTEVL